MTGREIIDVRVRRQVGDTVAGYRYLPATMLVYLNDGRRAIYTDHSEAFWSSAVLTAAPSELTSLGEDVGVHETFINALVDYICYRIHLENAQHANNATKAEQHLAAFTRAMAA